MYLGSGHTALSVPLSTTSSWLTSWALDDKDRFMHDRDDTAGCRFMHDADNAIFRKLTPEKPSNETDRLQPHDMTHIYIASIGAQLSTCLA